ncbi:MAG: hypothetical protein MZV65_47535 [Chromatiales bacterium]|nr:hypothetical protein [Chromatiales bacterium]
MFGTDRRRRIPACSTCCTGPDPVYVGGRLRGIEPPTHYDFPHLRDSPRELRDRFAKLGWRRVVAFQTRNPHAPRPSGTDPARRPARPRPTC